MKMNATIEWTALPRPLLEAFLCGSTATKPQTAAEMSLESLAKRLNNFRLTKTLVRRFKKEVESYFLVEYPDIQLIASEIQSKTRASGKPMQFSTVSEAIQYLSEQKYTDLIGDYYLKAITSVTNGEASNVFRNRFTSQVILDLTREYEQRTLYPYQKDAVDELKKFVVSNKSKGLLVMPTASGKTFTAVTFLLQNLVLEGYRIIWIAHKNMLLEQAALTFEKNSPLSYDLGSKKDKMTLRLISREHCRTSTASKGDDILIANIASISRKVNLSRLPFILKKNDKVAIVIDEAHHSIAPSYLKVLNDVKKITKNVKLIGLTATPSRFTEDEKNKLFNLFNNNIIKNVKLSKLITEGYIAKPNPITVNTNENYEENLNDEDTKCLEKKKILSPNMIKRIAKSAARNKLILQQYLNHEKEYGKTLIFALDQIHAITLFDEFTKAGINCEYVISGKKDNNVVIERFREKNDKIKVLINVEILTEGIDVPAIQTVFLTRPTSSDVLLMQMIGRGLRGTKAGGTEMCNIVTFQDVWDRYNYWLDPVFDIEDVDEAEFKKSEYSYKPHIMIPYRIIIEIYNMLKKYASGEILAKFDWVNIGWYDTSEDERIFVYNHTEYAFKLMEKNIHEIISGKLSSEDIIKKFFKDYESQGPVPDEIDIKKIVDYIKDNQTMPPFTTFELRDKVSVSTYIELTKDMNRADRNEYLKKSFETSEELKLIYRSFDKFLDCIFEEEKRQLYQDKKINYRYNPDKPALSKVKCHDLHKLFNEVVNGEFKGKIRGIPEEIKWTEQVVKGYYASTYVDFQAGEVKHISVNKVLNSTDIPAEVIKFLLYHEILHNEVSANHTPEFWAKEHEYPNFAEWDNILDTLSEKYCIEEWR